MITWLQARRATRKARDENAIAGALWHQGELSGFPLMDATGLSGGRLYAALIRMERDGRVERELADGPYPRRALYRLRAGTAP